MLRIATASGSSRLAKGSCDMPGTAGTPGKPPPSFASSGNRPLPSSFSSTSIAWDTASESSSPPALSSLLASLPFSAPPLLRRARFFALSGFAADRGFHLSRKVMSFGSGVPSSTGLSSGMLTTSAPATSVASAVPVPFLSLRDLRAASAWVLSSRGADACNSPTCSNLSCLAGSCVGGAHRFEAAVCPKEPCAEGSPGAVSMHYVILWCQGFLGRGWHV
mmetsp:Transcript_70850/g.169637  ORF Transcript_70850/g.169637 Transcript_70850/m.169637 type:complete len:220 (-) Transcript_70850:34-693(-)